MTPLVYTRLAEDRIRLLKLRPGNWDDDIEAELFEADQSFQYIALSYTWGSPVAIKEIVVNGTVKGITINLDLALRTIRSPDIHITLWVDALCINQDDIDDKSQQVHVMHHIFRWAVEVRGYVGHSLDRSQRDYNSQLKKLAASSTFQFPVNDDSSWEHIRDSLTLLESKEPAQLSPHERCLCMFGLIRALSSHSLHAKLKNVDLFSSNDTERMEPKLRHLFEWLRAFVIAPWWDRMWITQEVGVARELQLTYGKVIIPFDLLSNVVEELESRSFKLSPSGSEHTKVLDLLVAKVKKVSELRRLQRYESIGKMQDLGYFQRSLGSPLLWLLRTFRHRQSSEPRDKIYALSQLLGNLTTQAFDIETNYATSVASLFCKVVIRIMHETGIFWITSADLAAKSRDNLPSWVPNWADGFATPDPNTIAWKIRLCHNASDMRFTVQTPGLPPKSIKPSEYYSKLAKDAALLSEATLKGTIYKHEQEFPVDINSRREVYSSRVFHLDFQSSVDRQMVYDYYYPRLRDYTKVENCLRVPAQYCTTIHHVSEPLAPDLSNMFKIIKALKAAKHKLFPNDWDYDIYTHRLDSIGRILCFGVVMEQNNDVRLQGGWDDPNLAILVYLLSKMTGDAIDTRVEEEEYFTERHRDKFISEIMGGCAHCSVSTERPCQDCEDKAAEKPIPTLDDAWRDRRVKQVYRTALETGPGNCILLTKEGALALGPPQTEIGDRIYILTGGLCPYILRRDEVPQYLVGVTFRLIGDCYLDGAPKWDASNLENVVLV